MHIIITSCVCIYIEYTFEKVYICGYIYLVYIKKVRVGREKCYAMLHK